MNQQRDDSELSTVSLWVFDPTVPEVTFALQVVSGPDQGKSVQIDGSGPGRCYVGTSPVCALQLSDRTVSRRHAAFEISGETLQLTDLGSRNGVHFEGVKLSQAALRGGETLRLGETTLSVTVSGEANLDLPAATSFGNTLGMSTEMRRLYPLLERLAASDIPVIIEGETGTGKELLAESIHARSARASGPFVVFDCTTVPPNLIEAELFGHLAGAFGDARQARDGVVAQAAGGTLLIDEIGDLAHSLQAKLLRLIERREVRPLGSDTPQQLDVRILAASRRNLDEEVQAGRFRDDLFHRLAVGRIELPPLRHRRGDIRLLAGAFAHQLGVSEPLPASLQSRWKRHAWPGNVRELRNAVARYVVLGELGVSLDTAPPQPEVGGDDIVAKLLDSGLAFPAARQAMLDAFTERYIERALNLADGNVTRAAMASGVTRRYLQKLRAKGS